MSLQWLGEIKDRFKGRWANRYSRDPKEHAAAQLWQEQHQNDPGTLPYLLSKNGRDPVDPTDHEWEVAATVIQWLGSPIGQDFMRVLQDQWNQIDELKL